MTAEERLLHETEARVRVWIDAKVWREGAHEECIIV